MTRRGKIMIRYELYPADETLTTKQCAEAAGINRRTVVAWINSGILPATRRPGIRGRYSIIWDDFYQVLHTPALVKKPD